VRFGSLFAFFLTWWGAFVLGALDSSMLFFLPFGIDTLVVYLAARRPELFWVYPLLAASGSVAGAAVTFGVGRLAGDVGLERFVSGRRLERIQRRVRDSGAIAVALPALMPPPFPMTPFILACGALDVNRWKFFVTLAAARALRFGAEAFLARLYGRRILSILQSDSFQMIVAAFIAVAVVGTAVSAVLLWRRHRPPQRLRAA
jgi:membrane protein YqaA with SNARE-associated domain